jgi:hypothetical protein
LYYDHSVVDTRDGCQNTTGSNNPRIFPPVQWGGEVYAFTPDFDTKISSVGLRLQPQSIIESIGAILGKLCDPEDIEFVVPRNPLCGLDPKQRFGACTDHSVDKIRESDNRTITRV